MKVKKGWKRIIAVVLAAGMTMQLAACGSGDGVYEKNRKGYDLITDVPGISFDIPDGIMDFATAITQISEDIGFEPSNTYVYKDLDGIYFLFCMDAIVIAAQKNTQFGIRDCEDLTAAITGHDLFGIWFSVHGKKLASERDSSNGVVKLIADVDASVALTKNIYNDFVGKLTIVDDGSQEWAVFAGVVASQYDQATDNTLEGLDHIAKTVRNADIQVGPTDIQLVEGSVPESREETVNETATGTVVEETAEEVPVDETAEGEDSSDPNESTDTEETKTIRLNNQRKSVDDGTASISSIYSTLGLSQRGYVDVLTKDLQNESLIVTLAEVLQGGDAANFLSSELGSAEFVPASAGTTWNVAHYTITYPGQEKYYLNCMFTGMDGDNMRYRGIRYSKKTQTLRKGNDIYAYYLVPNGITEYLLKFGDSPLQDARCAYYKVRVED